MIDIKRLLSAFPATNSGDPTLVLHNYLTAVADFPTDFVSDAVTMFIKGEVPGHDGRFVPTAPMVATACRLVAEKVARAKYLEGLKAPRLPALDIERTDEQRGRARALMQQAVDNLAAGTALESATELEASKVRWEKTNARFQPEMTDRAIEERLLKRRPRYTVGDPDGDRDIA